MGVLGSLRVWLAGTALAGLLLVVVGYLLFIGPQRAATADAQEQLSTVQLQNSALQSRIIALTNQKSKIATYQRALRQARQALPSAGDTGATPDLLRSLQSISRATATSLSSIDVKEPDPTAAAPAPAATTGSTAPPAAAPATPASGLTTRTITVAVSGSTAGLNAFLTQLQTVQPRAVLITQVSLGSQADVGAQDAKHPSGTQTLHLTMNTFTTAADASTAPAAAPSATPSAAATSGP